MILGPPKPPRRRSLRTNGALLASLPTQVCAESKTSQPRLDVPARRWPKQKHNQGRQGRKHGPVEDPAAKERAAHETSQRHIRPLSGTRHDQIRQSDQFPADSPRSGGKQSKTANACGFETARRHSRPCAVKSNFTSLDPEGNDPRVRFAREFADFATQTFKDRALQPGETEPKFFNCLAATCPDGTTF